MGQFDASEFMKDIVSGLATLSEAIQIIGEPVEAGGKVIIPAVVARVGFGAGGGSGSSPGEGGESREEGSGGGGGGGATMTPVFLVVDEDGERLHTVPGAFQKATAVFEKAREAIDQVMPRKKGKSDLEEDEEFEDLSEGASGPAH